MRWVAAAALGVTAAAIAAVILLGDKDDPTAPRPLTTDEANRLAVTRFLNYQAGGRALTITVPNATGGLVITGSVDYRTHIGYGVVRGTGRDTSSDGLIQWTSTTVLVHPMTDSPAVAPATPPASGWHSRPLQASGMALDTALGIALGLGSDRPENAALLPQNGAAWVGRDTVQGRRTDVMNGPDAASSSGKPNPSNSSSSSSSSSSSDKAGTSQTVRYWIGSDGTMYRVRVGIASESQPVLFDFDDRRYVPVKPAPGITPAP